MYLYNQNVPKIQQFEFKKKHLAIANTDWYEILQFG